MLKLPSVVGIQAWFVANGVKLAIAAGILLAVSLGSYFKGRHDVEAKYARQQIAVYKKALEVQEREAKVEAAEAAQAARDKQVLDNKLETALGELNEAIDKVPSNPNCDLRPDELQFFRDLQGTN